MEIKNKHVLKDKGETANLPTIKQLNVKLGWTSAIDLDLMAFFTRKNGQPGGVFSDQISQDKKTMGDLNAFPFMALSGDAGVGKTTEGEETEELKIFDLAEIDKLYLVALNYDAVKAKNADATFSALNGHITIKTEADEVFDVPLNSTEKGTVALIATIDNTSAVAAQLKMENTVMGFSKFIETIPGASLLAK